MTIRGQQFRAVMVDEAIDMTTEDRESFSNLLIDVASMYPTMVRLRRSSEFTREYYDISHMRPNKITNWKERIQNVED